MAKILILGASVMGTALSVPLTDNGHINTLGEVFCYIWVKKY
jgi:glycerol-3-phosphate dehydrogenase (NAD(P)+)